MTTREKLEKLIGISFNDYPSSDYMPTEVSIPSFSRYPRYYFEKTMKEPLCGLFHKVKIITFEFEYHKNIVFEAPDFRLTHLSLLENLLEQLSEILGADKKRMLHLVYREYEELEQDTWEGRFWNFPAYDDLDDVMLNFNLKNGLSLTIFEPINLFDDEEDEDED